jgi:outer membrane protein OmpA-like peptidoglycan-associated protein
MNSKQSRGLWIVIGMLLHEGGFAAEQAKRFIACPIYRDTINARKSGCWLATENETGLRFDLQQAQTKPQLGQEILVEGMLPDEANREPDVCGAIVLKPVRVSTLPTPCHSSIIPAEGYPGRRFEVPNTAMTPNYLPQPQPQPPYVSRSYSIYFDYNSDYLQYQHAELLIQGAVRLALAGKAKRIVVTGYASTQASMVSGRTIQETLDVAKARALMVKEALIRLGTPLSMLSIEWKGDPVPAPDANPALQEASKRRVTIEVQI